MKKQNEKIPTIRKQYVQTIFDGLKTQFDETIKRQLEDQIDKTETLKSVYEDSFQAQSSIIRFLTRQLKQKLSSQQNNIFQLKKDLIQLEKQDNKQRKSSLILSLNAKLQETNKVMNALSAALEEYKNQNQAMSTKLQQSETQQRVREQQFQRALAEQLEQWRLKNLENQEKLLQKLNKISEYQETIQKLTNQNQQQQKTKQQNSQKIKELTQIISSLQQKNRAITCQIHQKNNQIMIQTLQLTNLKYLSQQNTQTQTTKTQTQTQTQQIQIQTQIQTQIQKNYKILQQQLQYRQNQIAEMTKMQQKDRKLIQQLQEQIDGFVKFATIQERKTINMKRKISERQSINKQELEKLRLFSDSMLNKNLGEQDEECRTLSRSSNSLTVHQSGVDYQLQNYPELLEKITEKPSEYNSSSNGKSEHEPSENDSNEQQKQVGGQKGNKINNTSFTQKRIKEDLEENNVNSIFKVNQDQDGITEDSGQLVNARILVVRQCKSQHNYPSESDQQLDNTCIQNQIQNFKAQLVAQFQKKQAERLSKSEQQSQVVRQSILRNSIKTVVLTQAVGRNLIESSYEQQITKQSEGKMNTATRNSNIILQRLDESRAVANQYQKQLEEQIQILNQRIINESIKFKLIVTQKNDKIDELISKIEQLEQFRVRMLSGTEKMQQILTQKQSTIQILSTQQHKLKYQNKQFYQMHKTTKQQLQCQRRKIQNLQDEIRQLNNQKQKIMQQRNSTQGQIKYNWQIKKQLQDRIEIQEGEIRAGEEKIGQLNGICEGLRGKLVSVQEVVIELEGNVLQYRRCVDQLQSKIQQKNQQQRMYLDQIQKLKIKIRQLTQKLHQIKNMLGKKQQQISRLVHDKNLLQKSNEDLKYMNSILKKDMLKIKQIESKDWQKQYQQCTNLPGSKTIKISNMNQETEKPVRIKNYSFSGASSINTMNPVIKQTNIKNDYLSSILGQGQGKQNSQPINKYESKFSINETGKKKNYINLDLDLNLNLNYPGKRIKNQMKNSRVFQESICLTERPITEIIKKKYQL